MRRSPLELTLDERKSVLIQSSFLEMADLDYLTARWTYENGIFHNFYWSVAQSLEKYLKALLLYNGLSVKKYSHDLVVLFEKACEIDPEFDDAKIKMPKTTGMGRENWEDKSLLAFVEYLDHYGSPDARYSLNGTFINGPVIHPLDYSCMLVRRSIRRHNFLSDDLFEWSKSNAHYCKTKMKCCEWMISVELPLEMLFTGVYQVGQSEKLRDVFRAMNFAFFDERIVNESTFGGNHLSMAPMRNHLIRLRDLDKSAGNQKIIDDLRIWADSNMKLPKDIRDALADQ